jgi:hypothetical protein
MNKEFVPYELVLALKQLGFDEPCLGYFTKNSLELRKPYPLCGKTHSAILYQQAFKFVLTIIENDSKLDRKFRTKFFLDFTYEGFAMDDNELSTTYESDEETLANIINFIILNK